MAKQSGRGWLVFGFFILSLAFGVAALVRWGWKNNENAQRLSATSTALMAEVNTRSTALTDLESQQGEGERQSQIALAHQLAAQAQLLFAPHDSKEMTALLLAIESMRLSSTVEAAQIL